MTAELGHGPARGWPWAGVLLRVLEHGFTLAQGGKTSPTCPFAFLTSSVPGTECLCFPKFHVGTLKPTVVFWEVTRS